MERVRAYDRESMKSISLGSPSLTTEHQAAYWNMTYGSGRTLHIAGKHAF